MVSLRGSLKGAQRAMRTLTIGFDYCDRLRSLSIVYERFALCKDNCTQRVRGPRGGGRNLADPPISVPSAVIVTKLQTFLAAGPAAPPEPVPAPGQGNGSASARPGRYGPGHGRLRFASASPPQSRGRGRPRNDSHHCPWPGCTRPGEVGNALIQGEVVPGRLDRPLNRPRIGGGGDRLNSTGPMRTG